MLKFALPSTLALFCVSLAATQAAEGHVVRQKGREFDRASLTVPRGETVRFTNDDEFLHQVYVDAPAFGFDSAEQAPGQDVEVAFTEAGLFEVRCGIHPRMRLEVTVQD